MTDRQIETVVLDRASKCFSAKVDDLKIVLTQQYGKKLYFNIKFKKLFFPIPIAFRKNGKTVVFSLPSELPDRVMQWKRDLIRQMMSTTPSLEVEFDIDTFPKEIVHIFSSSIISALNTPGMEVILMQPGFSPLFQADETYEEVQVEADLMGFGNEWMA